ncbi:MAG TPA: UTP--glucose-1-phosphate uridylyltransferase, partial [Candidatus Hydrogenedentes bacterium]|nr:UTP--glucose-1-phosphate uridylyltransferase [Candidatus Hydrogenedentota bacterium]
MGPLLETITSADSAIRNRPFRALCATMTTEQILAECEELEVFRRTATNLYERVQALLFLHAAYRFFLMEAQEIPPTGHVPYDGYADLLERRFEQAIARFRAAAKVNGLDAALCSALADAYHQLTFQTLFDQVRRSVRESKGNRWMFRVGNALDHPVRIRPELLQRPEGALLYPVLAETTPVRLDLSHSGWSDIFFLGMDYPEGARVLTISVN